MKTAPAAVSSNSLPRAQQAQAELAALRVQQAQLSARQERVQQLRTWWERHALAAAASRAKATLAEPAPCCAVCLMELGHAVGDSETCQLRGCGHRFHTACVREWLSHKATCPLCRNQATIASIATDAIYMEHME